MKQESKILNILLLSCLWTIAVQAQETIPVTGVTATGSGGSVSYTIGQVANSTISGTNGSIIQGVQQPYEISVVTAIENTESITLQGIVYPNPTTGIIRLVFESYDYENLRFRIYDINGALLQDKKVESRETEISLVNLASSVYFLKVLRNNLEVKVFNIVKK